MVMRRHPSFYQAISLFTSHAPAWAALALVLILDRATKMLVLATMQPGQSIPVIANVFHLTFLRNTGIAFSFFQDANAAFIAISSAIIVMIGFFLSQVKKEERLLNICLGALLGGALGNLIDRVLYGSVIDFLDFRVWPVFNAADSAITISAICLVVLLWKK